MCSRACCPRWPVSDLVPVLDHIGFRPLSRSAAIASAATSAASSHLARRSLASSVRACPPRTSVVARAANGDRIAILTRPTTVGLSLVRREFETGGRVCAVVFRIGESPGRAVSDITDAPNLACPPALRISLRSSIRWRACVGGGQSGCALGSRWCGVPRRDLTCASSPPNSFSRARQLNAPRPSEWPNDRLTDVCGPSAGCIWVGCGVDLRR